MERLLKYLDERIEQASSLETKAAYLSVRDTVVTMVANDMLECYTKRQMEAMFCIGIMNKPHITVDEMSDILQDGKTTFATALKYVKLHIKDHARTDAHDGNVSDSMAEGRGNPEVP